MNIEEIKERHTAGYVTTFSTPMEVIAQYGNDVRYLLSITEQQDNLLSFVDSIVEELRKPVEKTESGATQMILINTLIQKYSYYKQYPNELHAYLQAIRGK